ncbi:MAG: DUF4440 domain-containing protein [Desulfarculus sp.]|nr:DUF4440 domain-containing protein [Desulfarculus sp.]
MKRRCALVILAALALSLLAGPALAWDEAKLKAEAQALLDQAAAAFVKKDLDALAGLATPQAVFRYQGGQTMTMAQWREAMARDFGDMQEFASKFVVEKAWPRGKGLAGVVYRESHQFTRPSDPGHQHAIKAHFRAYLVKTPQGWRFQEFHDLGTQFTRDGKPVKAPASAKKPSKS